MKDLFDFKLDEDDSGENEFELICEEHKYHEPEKLIKQK